MSDIPLPSATHGAPEDLAAYRLLTSDEAALVLAVPVATLRTWRSRRRGYSSGWWTIIFWEKVGVP